MVTIFICDCVTQQTSNCAPFIGAQSYSIALTAVISGLTCKRSERVNSALYWPFGLVCMPFWTKEYLTAGSTRITAWKQEIEIVLFHWIACLPGKLTYFSNYANSDMQLLTEENLMPKLFEFALRSCNLLSRDLYSIERFSTKVIIRPNHKAYG